MDRLNDRRPRDRKPGAVDLASIGGSGPPGDKARRRFSGRYFGTSKGDQAQTDAKPGPSGKRQSRVALLLHVDVDGPHPLGVVSGTVRLAYHRDETATLHFIGRIVDDDGGDDERHVVVADFDTCWPSGDTPVNRMSLHLTRSGSRRPRATVRFFSTVGDQQLDAIFVSRTSSSFRRVEIDIDHERQAAQVEPYDTHLHPDRPSQLPRSAITIKSAFADAGIHLVETADSNHVVEISEAGDDEQWSDLELNDSMQLHWEGFANRPQWKAWVFLAGKSDRKRLGGVMFDGNIAEPGGIDRQGIAVFTRCEYFYSSSGGYAAMNPPEEAAIRRELLFNSVHELGHVFNLAHPNERRAGQAWHTPSWMRFRRSRRALTWMNYPNSAMPGYGANASWFYKRFMFSFGKNELLFLRHAPEHHVQMGADAWFHNHARVGTSSVDRRLELAVRIPKRRYELGEPVFAELRLRNVGDESVQVHGSLDPCDGFVEIAVIDPTGVRRPHVPILQTRIYIDHHRLEPQGMPLYESVDLTVGLLGFPFKTPGHYTVEACYVNLDGSVTEASADLDVCVPPSVEIARVVSDLFEARMGRVLYVGGTRAQDDINEKLDWVQHQLGPAHPVTRHLAYIRYIPFARAAKIVHPASPPYVAMGSQPDLVINHLAEGVTDNSALTAETMGLIRFRRMADTVTAAALHAGKADLACQTQKQLLNLLDSRGAPSPVIASVGRKIDMLRRGASVHDIDSPESRE